MIRVILATALGALAGLGFGPVFGGVPGPRAFLVALAAVVLVAGAVSLAALRMPATIAALMGSVGVVITAMVTAGSYVDIHHGPKQLLTGALPTEATGPVLATVAVVVGWSTLAAGLLAAYANNSLAPLPPIFLCLLAALSLGASSRPLPTWYPLVAVVLVVSLLLAGGSAMPSPMAIGAGALTAVAAVAAAAVIGPAAPGLGNRPPADLRSLVAAPVTPRSGVSPLQQYLALRNGTRPIKATGTVSRPGSLLRMATLTKFDGGYWTVDGDYRRATTMLPQPGQADLRTEVTQQVTVVAGELDWLLTAGRATSVSVPGLGVDEATGDVAIPIDVNPPTEYSATSTVVEASLDEILAAQPVPVPDPIPTLPPQLVSFVDGAVAGQPEGSDQLLALYRRFTQASGEDAFKYDQSAEATGGHGYFHLQRLLETHRGTSEQYASAYAVMARHLGYDARVVMGLRPRYTGESFEAAGQDVDAWAEVNFTGIGWVSIDPSPRDNPEGVRPNAPPAPVQRNTVDDPLNDPEQTPIPVAPEELLPEDSETGTAGSMPVALKAAILAGAGALAVLLLVLAAPAAKAVQRMRRRRARSDRLAILGAWRDTLDRLREAGVRVGPAHTTGDVSRLADAALLPQLGAMADQAAYAPDTPAPSLRTQAWRMAANIRGQVRATMRPGRRLRAFLDPRALIARRYN